MSDSKDLWELGQVKGRQDERERIIKLLEEQPHHMTEAETEHCYCDYNYSDAIALIKGENK